MACDFRVMFANMTVWKKIIVAVAVISPNIALGTATLRAADWAPKDPPSQYSTTAGPNAVRSNTPIVDVCTTAEQLDCLESIGAYLSDKWVEGVFQNSTNVGSDGKPYSTNWKIPGLINLNGTNDVEASLRINYTGNVFLQTELYARGDKGMTDEAGLQRNVPFRATVRTSWVLPTFVSGKLSNTKISVEKLSQSGASRITAEGVPLILPIVLDESSLTSETGKSAYENRTFGMTVADGRFYPIKSGCITQPTLMISDNAYGHALPKFEKGNLDLRISAPHFKPDGKTPHRGAYEAIIPLPTAKCLWGNDLTASSQFKVEVFETEGVTKTATQSVTVTSDAISIFASGFTFSSPTIRVSYVSTAAPTSTTSTPVTVPVSMKKPARPSIVSAKGTKKTATVVISRATGVSYKATAVKGKTKKALRCTTSSTKVTCSTRSLTKGTWKVSVVPSNSAGAGTAATRTIRVP